MRDLYTGLPWTLFERTGPFWRRRGAFVGNVYISPVRVILSFFFTLYMAFFSPCLYHSHYSASYEVPSSTLLERTGGFYKGPPGTLLERPRTLFERTGGLGFVGIVFISPCIWAMSIPQPLWRLLRSLLQRTSWDPFKEDGGPLQKTS